MAVPAGEAVKTAPSWREQVTTWALFVAGANVYLIRVWVDLLAHDPWPAHRDFGPPAPAHYAGAITLVLLIGTAMYLIACSRLSRVLKALIFAGWGILGAKEAFLSLSGLGWFERALLLRWQGLVALGALVVVAAMGGRWLSVHGTWLSRRLAVTLLPLVGITFGNSIWRGVQWREPAAQSFDQRGAPTNGLRAVWIILDEIDEDVAFSSRPKGLELPALDRFRREAQFVAQHAESPANATSVSIPKLVGLEDEGGSVFSRARRLGLRSGIVGWAVPYCQWFRKDVDACAWWPMAQQHNTYGTSFGQIVMRMGISLLESNQLSPFGQTLAVQTYVRTVREMSAAAQEMAGRSDLDLVYLHLSPPHNPYVYDPATGRLDVVPRNLPNAPGYLRNLVLADRVFGGIRAAMEKAGTWDRSIVVVTGDHGFRSKHLLGYPKTDQHVPFMVRSPKALGNPPADPLQTLQAGSLLLRWLRP